MKMKKNVATAIISGALVGCLAIGGTFAYLTANSGKVVNTFSASQGLGVLISETTEDRDTYDINKTETGWMASGTDGIEYTNVVPGAEIIKNVDVKVTENPTPSYLFIKITTANDNYTIAAIDNQWKPVAGQTGVYVLSDESGAMKVDSSENDVVFDVFDQINANADVTDADALNGGNITVKAAVVQATGITYDEAVAEAVAQLD